MALSWQFWALLAAAFAALTAIFGKIGVAGLQSDYATFLRTIVILVMTAAIVTFGGHWRSPAEVPGRALVFLILSGLATGASWLCYFRALQIGQASQVAPVDKLSVVLVALFGGAFLGERLSFQNWTGVALIAAGTILVAWR
ncbi:EamA family transporter [Aureimonas mangrovi]|uniref:EamA family transporter n=1 Tax=Aureimonas mangrovi TaxID=2758041 RepID=UPI00163D4435|nr:EamA family transporter [Aureimonas mangrovi]